MLNAFISIRCLLEESTLVPESRHINGFLNVTTEIAGTLKSLDDNGYIEEALDERGITSTDWQRNINLRMRIKLNPCTLEYYEDLRDLISRTLTEPDHYYLHADRALVNGQARHQSLPSLVIYRRVLGAKALLRLIADFPENPRVILLTPDRIDIPLSYEYQPQSPTELMKDLTTLAAEFREGDEESPKIEQRKVILKKTIREHLKSHPPDERFQSFVDNFETIYDSYRRDYQLWVGITFGEIEKSFEEKRLKFVSDLNGILAGVQASVIAVPIAGLLAVDKYDLESPIKDFLLASVVSVLAFVCYQLLHNQEATLNSTRVSIDATKNDFQKKHPNRPEEFKARLRSLDEQEKRVRGLLKLIQIVIVVILVLAHFGWIIASLHSLG